MANTPTDLPPYNLQPDDYVGLKPRASLADSGGQSDSSPSVQSERIAELRAELAADAPPVKRPWWLHASREAKQAAFVPVLVNAYRHISENGFARDWWNAKNKAGSVGLFEALASFDADEGSARDMRIEWATQALRLEVHPMTLQEYLGHPFRSRADVLRMLDKVIKRERPRMHRGGWAVGFRRTA